MKKTYIGIGVVVLVILVILGAYQVSKKAVPSQALQSTPGALSNSLPMYGAVSYEDYVAKRPEAAKTTDDAFVKGIIDEKGGSVKQAFSEGLKLGWNFLAQNDPDTAMSRFNQAWLIDHDNFNVYWGYAAVLGTKGDLVRAASYFDHAVTNYAADDEINSRDYFPLWYDASRTYVDVSNGYLKDNPGEAAKYANKAIELINRALKDKNIPTELILPEKMSLAFAYFNAGDYANSRKTFNEVRKDYATETNTDATKAFDAQLKAKGV